MRLIKLHEVKSLSGLGRTSIYTFMKEGEFPKSVSLGGRAVAWVEEEVLDWIQSRIELRDSQG